MERAFGKGGERPNKIKETSKYGEKMRLSPNGTLSLPTELYVKPVRESSSSPQAVYNKSIAKIDSILDRLTLGNTQIPLEPAYIPALYLLSEIAVLREDSQSATERARQIEAAALQATDSDRDQLLPRPPVAFGPYLSAMFLGDETAAEKVSGYLSEERTKGKLLKQESFLDEKRFFPTVELPMLSSVVEQCAEDKLPADTWIARFAVDEEHAAALKLYNYYEYLKNNKKDSDNTIGETYRDEVTQLFLEEGGMREEFAWYEANSIYCFQEDERKKRAILDKFKTLHDAVPLTASTQRSFFNFAGDVLNDPELLSQKDIAWFIDAAVRYSGPPLTEVEDYRKSFDVDLIKGKGASATELIDKINGIFVPSSSEDDQDVDSDRPADPEERDFELARQVRKFAEKGDFDMAGGLLCGILHEDFRMGETLDCFEHVKTVADLHTLRPDQLTLQLYPELKTVYLVKESLLLNDSEDVANFARSFARDLAQNGFDEVADQHKWQLMNECLDAIYKHDNQHGEQLSLEMEDIFIENDAETWLIRAVAEKNVEQGNKEGLATLYEAALNQEELPQQTRALAEVALLAYKASIDKDTPAE